MKSDEFINLYLDYLEGNISEEEFSAKLPPLEYPHGALVDYKQEAYCDRYIFEDGYEEIYMIGD